MESDRIKIKPLLIVIAVICLAEFVLGYVIMTEQYPRLLVIGVGRIAETILILWIVLIWGGGLPSFGLTPSVIVPSFIKGLIVSAAFGVFTAVVFTGLMIVGYNPLTWIHADLPSVPKDLIIFLIVGTIVGPMAEEVFFRGVLYGFFRRWGIITAVVLSTLLFVLAHPTGFAVSWSRIVGGILFAAAYEWTGSLVTPLTIHALGNLAIFSLSLISKWI